MSRSVFTVAAEAGRVLARFPGGKAADMDHGLALALGRALRAAARGPAASDVRVDRRLRVVRAGDHVAVVGDGHVLLNAPAEVCGRIGAAVLTQALKAEGHAKADAVADDQAFLIRAGIPVGLSDDPAVNREAFRRAQHLKTPLAPAGPAFRPGTPTILQTPPG